MIKKILFTKQGVDGLNKELSGIQVQRVEAVKNLQTAREMGDLSENAAYKVARSKLSSIDRRIRQIKIILAQAKIVEKKENDLVNIGSFVTILNEGEYQTFEIVGGYESDISQNKISFYSPIGKALMNKKVNDVVIIKIPAGEVAYKIVKIE